MYEDQVTRHMTVGVVHALEAVEIDDEDRKRSTARSGAKDLLLQFDVEETAIEHAGQWVQRQLALERRYTHDVARGPE